MRRRVVEAGEPITRINVTPIIDVALVLVIILLVTAPLLSQADLPVDLPQARTREAENQRNVSITYSARGELALDEKRVAPDVFRGALRAKLAEPGNENVLVVVRADSGVPYGAIRELLDEARTAGAKHIAIATRQRVEPERRSPPISTARSGSAAGARGARSGPASWSTRSCSCGSSSCPRAR